MEILSVPQYWVHSTHYSSRKHGGGGPSGIENYLHMCADQRRRGCQSVTSVAFLPTMCRRRTVPGVGCS